jgi:hypothetical protein
MLVKYQALLLQVAGSILAQEREELEIQYALEADQPESCFIQVQ